jgi:hypothetical protein
LQRRARTRELAAPVATAHREALLAVEPVDALVVNAGVLGAQQVVHASVAEAATCVRDAHDLVDQPSAGFIDLRRIAPTVAGEPHKTASPAFREPLAGG